MFKSNKMSDLENTCVRAEFVTREVFSHSSIKGRRCLNMSTEKLNSNKSQVSFGTSQIQKQI